MLFHKFVVIGAGKTGLDITQRLMNNGLDVLLVESNDIGGAYLFSSDYPKVVMTNQAKEFVNINQSYPNVDMDPEEIKEFITKRVKSRVAARYKKINSLLKKSQTLEIIYGNAEFESKNLLNIIPKSGDKIVVAFEHCIICTGKSEMNLLDIKGLENVPFMHQHNSFFGEIIPEKLAIIGISKDNLEIAEMFTNLGSKVVIFEQEAPEKILPNLDTTAINYLLQNLLRKGIEFYFNIEIREVTQVILNSKNQEATDQEDQQPKKMGIQIEDDEENKYVFSHIYCPVVENYKDNLGLDKIGIKFSEKGVYCTSGGLTTLKNIWAFGQASNSFKPVNINQQLYNFVEKNKNANKENEINLSRSLVMLNPNNNQNATEIVDLNFNYELINLNRPVSTVGIPYKQAINKYGPIIRFNIIFSDEKEGFLKLIYNEHSKQILGFAAAGDVCKELYNTFIGSILKNTTVKDYENIIYNLGYKR
jgi:pyruvate/2-oxoglutarate dehydrogenase complex dihydrolipoamide dehydrogenase (E3) component